MVWLWQGEPTASFDHLAPCTLHIRSPKRSRPPGSSLLINTLLSLYQTFVLEDSSAPEPFRPYSLQFCRVTLALCFFSSLLIVMHFGSRSSLSSCFQCLFDRSSTRFHSSRWRIASPRTEAPAKMTKFFLNISVSSTTQDAICTHFGLPCVRPLIRIPVCLLLNDTFLKEHKMKQTQRSFAHELGHWDYMHLTKLHCTTQVYISHFHPFFGMHCSLYPSLTYWQRFLRTHPRLLGTVVCAGDGG